MFVAVLARRSYLSLSWTRLIQSTVSHNTSLLIRFNIILLSERILYLFLQFFRSKLYIHLLFLPSISPPPQRYDHCNKIMKIVVQTLKHILFAILSLKKELSLLFTRLRGQVSCWCGRLILTPSRLILYHILS
jgi:hypothetical protein